MTKEELAKIMYNESRIGFDVTWDHKNLPENSRGYYRRAAEAAAKALGVTLDEPAPKSDPRYEAARKCIPKSWAGIGDDVARAIVAAIDADKEMR